MSKERIKCRRCNGKGSKDRVVVIGTIVTIIKDTCYACGGTGEDKRIILTREREQYGCY